SFQTHLYWRKFHARHRPRRSSRRFSRRLRGRRAFVRRVSAAAVHVPADVTSAALISETSVKTINQIGTVFFTDKLASVTTERVRSALEASNLDPMFAHDLSKRYCFSRAKNQLQAEGLIDEIEETPERWTWQLSRRFREAEHLGYEFDSTKERRRWARTI